MSVWIDDIYLPDIGVKVLAGGSEPALPSTRDRSVQIPGRHGAYVFTGDLDVRQFEILCAISGIRNHNEIALKAREVARLFTDGYGRSKTVKLRFESEPDRFYYARISGSLPVEKVAYIAKLTLPLTAYDPIAKSSVEIGEEIIWDSDVSVLSDFELDGNYNYSYSLTSGQTLQLTNNGSLTVRPKITISGSASSMTIKANGKTFGFGSFTNKTFEIDGDNYTVKVDGENTLSAMDGDFIELISGLNDVVVSGSGLDIDITFRFYNQYL